MHDLGGLPLKTLPAFRAAGQQGSFQGAARVLNLTPSAISHQIRALERWAGVALFRRETRHIVLTREGKRFLTAVEGGLRRIAEAGDALRHDAVQMRVRVSALPLFTSVVLIPQLEDFTRRHPDIELSIETSNQVVDLTRDPFDVGIRNAESPTPGLLARKLFDTGGVPVCAPYLVQGPKALRQPSDLAQHTLIHITARMDAWPRWLAEAGVHGLKARRNLAFDTVPAALEAAARGQGVALGLHPLIWHAPIGQALVQPFPLRPMARAAYYAVHRKADRDRPAVKAFIDWLVAATARLKRRSVP